MKKVVNVLQAVPAIEVVETSVPAKTVTLCYEDDQVQLEQIEAALQAIGHVIGRQEVVSGPSTLSQKSLSAC